MSAYNGDAEFARRLRRLIRASGKTTDAFADEFGVTRAHIHRWCNLRNAPTLYSLRRVKAALGCTWEELLG